MGSARFLAALRSLGLAWWRAAACAYTRPTAHPPLCLPAAPLQAPFELIGPIYPLLEQYAAEKLREEYQDSGSVEMELRVEEGAAARLADAVRDATSGRVAPRRV